MVDGVWCHGLVICGGGEMKIGPYGCGQWVYVCRLCAVVGRVVGLCVVWGRQRAGMVRRLPSGGGCVVYWWLSGCVVLLGLQWAPVLLMVYVVTFMVVGVMVVAFRLWALGCRVFGLLL